MCVWRSWLSVQRWDAHFDSCMKVGGLIKKRIKVFRPITSMNGELPAANGFQRGGEGQYRLDYWWVGHFLVVMMTFLCPIVLCANASIYTHYIQISIWTTFFGLIRVNVISISLQDIVDWRPPVCVSRWVCAFLLRVKGPLIVYSIMTVDTFDVKTKFIIHLFKSGGCKGDKAV